MYRPLDTSMVRHRPSWLYREPVRWTQGLSVLILTSSLPRGAVLHTDIVLDGREVGLGTLRIRLDGLTTFGPAQRAHLAMRILMTWNMCQADNN